jgi:hypothetical protein
MRAAGVANPGPDVAMRGPGLAMREPGERIPLAWNPGRQALTVSDGWCGSLRSSSSWSLYCSR